MLTIHLSQALSLAIGVVLPLVVGFITKESWGAGIRAVLLALLTGATAFLTTWKSNVDANTAFDLTEALLTWLATFLTGVGLHFGFLNPTGLSGAAKNSGISD